MRDRPSVTVIQHDPVVPLGRFTAWLEDLDLAFVRAWEGDPIPSVDGVGEGLIVLGGRMNAYDDEGSPWLPATRRLIAATVAADLPMLGICLGHQLLAAALGGTVAVAAPQCREAGLVEIAWHPDAADDPVLGAVVTHDGGQTPQECASAYQYAMHDDAVVELPPGAVCLASSAQYPVQAMRAGSALGVQFHPEASPERIRAWAERNGSSGPAVDAAVSGAYDDDVARTGRAIARGLAGQVLSRELTARPSLC